MNIMKNYLLQHIRKLIFATGIVIICSIASMVPMLLTQKLIDVGFINKDFRYIVACSLYIGIITIVKSGLSYISLKQFSNVGHTIVADLRSDIFDKLLRFPIDYFTEKGSGYLLSRLNEVSQISSLFSPNNVKFLTGFIEAIFALVMIGRTNTNLLILCCIPMVIYIWISMQTTKNYQKIINDALESDAQYTGKLNEVITGQEEIRLNNGKKQEQEKFHRYSENLKNKAIQHTLLLGGTTEILTLVTTFVSVFIYIVCGYFVIRNQLTIGEAIAVTQYAGKLYTPIISFSSVILIVQPALLSIKRIDEAFYKNVLENCNGNKTIDTITELNVKNLCYSYPSRQREIIQNLSFDIKEPSLCYIKGSNGSGKTTLAKILLKLIDGYSGEILINGIELRQISEQFYRNQCAAVSQRTFLFNDTIYNNIVYGISDVTPAHYEQAIRLSGLDKVLRLLPDKEKTIIGENGATLSGGEKQKISIARALLKNANVIILDEPSNNLDKKSLYEIKCVLEKISHEKMVIVIDHNDIFEAVASLIINL